MNPADPNQMRTVLEQQGISLGLHQTQLKAVISSIGDLTAQIQPLQLNQSSAAAPTTSSSSPPPAHEPRLPPPEQYSGEPGTCRSLLSRSLVFELQPTTFPSERAKVAYVITQLSGRAREWGTALWEARSPSCGDFQNVAAEMRRALDRSKHGHEAARELLHIHQGRRSVSNYAIDFQTLATSSGWNSEALFDIFLNGLSEEIKDELVAPKPASHLRGPGGHCRPHQHEPTTAPTCESPWGSPSDPFCYPCCSACIPVCFLHFWARAHTN